MLSDGSGRASQSPAILFLHWLISELEDVGSAGVILPFHPSDDPVTAPNVQDTLLCVHMGAGDASLDTYPRSGQAIIQILVCLNNDGLFAKASDRLGRHWASFVLTTSIDSASTQ